MTSLAESALSSTFAEQCLLSLQTVYLSPQPPPATYCILYPPFLSFSAHFLVKNVEASNKTDYGYE